MLLCSCPPKETQWGGEHRRGVCFCLYSGLQRGKDDTCGGRGACISNRCACAYVCLRFKKRGECMSSQAAAVPSNNPALSVI